MDSINCWSTFKGRYLLLKLKVKRTKEEDFDLAASPINLNPATLQLGPPRDSRVRTLVLQVIMIGKL